MARLDPALIKDLALFRGVAEPDLRAILQAAQTRRIARKTPVFSQGQQAKEFFVLLSGHLKVVQAAPDGQQTILRIIGPGDPYGMAVAIGRADYPGTAVAMEESLTLVWPSSEWRRLVERAPQLAANALQTVGRRLQEAHARIREFSTDEAERRIARALLGALGESGNDRAASAGGFPITRQEIAEMAGTTIYTVSRVLSAWQDQGLLEGGRERVIIKDRIRLRAIADRTPPSQ